jgi:phosphotriesterase-related protein
VRTGLPLMIHLPGWFRLGHKVLDIAEEEGAELRHTVLCHMNPSHDDLGYQQELASRGAFLEYDMIGMDFFYADQQVQCPSDEEAARAIVKLVEKGYIDRLLLSHDVFLKMMLTRYGGNGYAYILKHFLPRLKRHGLGDRQLDILMRDNPRSVFEAKI